MDQQKIQQFGDELYEAMVKREAVSPLTSRGEDISIEDAYHISLRMLERRQQAGARVIGKKIGVTSKAVMNMLNVHQPDFGYLTDDMVFNSGEAVPISDRLIAPRAEGEIAFILKKDLTGPGITNADVLAATECVMPCFEIVDSRIQDWKIAIQDTVCAGRQRGFAPGYRPGDLRHGGGEERFHHQHRRRRSRVELSSELRGLAGQHPGRVWYFPEGR